MPAEVFPSTTNPLGGSVSRDASHAHEVARRLGVFRPALAVRSGRARTRRAQPRHRTERAGDRLHHLHAQAAHAHARSRGASALRRRCSEQRLTCHARLDSGVVPRARVRAKRAGLPCRGRLRPRASLGQAQQEHLARRDERRARVARQLQRLLERVERSHQRGERPTRLLEQRGDSDVSGRKFGRALDPARRAVRRLEDRHGPPRSRGPARHLPRRKFRHPLRLAFPRQ